MIAHGADLGSLCANHQMTAVAALPHGDTALFKDRFGLHILQQCAVALLMGLLDCGNAPELLRKRMEALFIGLLCHAVVHIRPLGILAFGGMKQVFGSISQLAQSLEPELGMLFLILGSLEEQCGNLLVARLLGNRGKVGIFVPGLALTCESFPQILLGFGAGIGILGGSLLHLYKLARRLLAHRALEIFSHRTFMYITADTAFPFFHFY